MSSHTDRHGFRFSDLIAESFQSSVQRTVIHIIFVAIAIVAVIVVQADLLGKIPTAFNWGTLGGPTQVPPPTAASPLVIASIATPATSNELSRQTDSHTNIPTRPRTDISTYTVQGGDSFTGIAAKFNLTLETLVFSNPYLNDDVHSLRPNQQLLIAPVNGVIRYVQKADSLESLAKFYKVDIDSIVNWPGNKTDLSTLKPTEPIVSKMAENSLLMIPGGTRGIVGRPVVTISKQTRYVISDAGPGQCSGGYSGGAVGSGTFAWPVSTRSVSGNNYTSVHLAVDLAAAMGQAIFAADSGVVTFAGWSNWGYGNMVVLDHGNGWQTLYAHLSQWNVGCGQSVLKGNIVGLGGSTGNSTGPHLHFEMNINGTRPNPLAYLPQ
ncbi:MAG: M23 family metallopeptidase [Chloroflexi bacterium]|nr:M23 family metallopeptidase [Chloroflexota bacterium]